MIKMQIDITNYFSGPIPPGFDVNANLAMAQQYAKTHTSNETLDWFNHMVRSNLDAHLPQSVSWDFKQIDPKYADFGNFWFGIAGKVAGVSDDLLKAGAGYAQGISDKLTQGASIARVIKNWGTTYGDNAGDTSWIQYGINAATAEGIASQNQIGLGFGALLYLGGQVKNFAGTPPTPVYSSSAANVNGLPAPIFEYIDSSTVKVLPGGSLEKIAESERASSNSISTVSSSPVNGRAMTFSISF
jgi:hypothetical protein